MRRSRENFDEPGLHVQEREREGSQEDKMRSRVLRFAAGIFALLGIITVPILFVTVEGWRKSAVIPMTYLVWKFASYTFKREIPYKREE